MYLLPKGMGVGIAFGKPNFILSAVIFARRTPIDSSIFPPFFLTSQNYINTTLSVLSKLTIWFSLTFVLLQILNHIEVKNYKNYVNDLECMHI